jgi:hypothetical protein
MNRAEPLFLVTTLEIEQETIVAFTEVPPYLSKMSCVTPFPTGAFSEASLLQLFY